MILAVGVAAVILLSLLGQLIPRFLLAVVRELRWRRGERRRQRLAFPERRLEAQEPGGRVARLGEPVLSAPFFADESGNALPSALALLTLVAFGYVAVAICRSVLRVAGALP